jgi:large subunit ribosomal protein L6
LIVSRIGKKPIVIPSGVKVAVAGNRVSVEGPKGKLDQEITSGIAVAVEEGQVLVSRGDNLRQSRANQGLVRALVANMVKGVHLGYRKVLEISGVGYRAETGGRQLVLALGFSHRVEYPIPDGVEVAVEKNTRLTITGIDRQKVGQFTAQIRKIRVPDPYKAKGITYEGERIKRKAGKKAIT